MRKAKMLSFLLALAMVVTALVPATVQAAGKVVTVGTQAELEEALKDPEVTKIAIKAKKGKTLTIPEGNYSGIALVVEAAKVKLNNHGTFRVVKVRDAKEYNEHATGNTVKITAPKITVAVAETAEVKALHLAKKDAEHTVEIKGEVKKVTVAESAKVDLTVDGTLEALNVKKASDVTVAGTTEKTIVVNTSTDSHGTTLETAVTVDVRTKDFIDITLTEGSEGSDVIVKNDAGDVKLHNQTEATVLVEEKDGTQHEAEHTEIVDTRDQAEIEADEAVTPDAGETEDTTGDDTTTEDGKTEDTTGDETTSDDTTTEDTAGDATTEDATGDTTTGGSTGSTSTVTPPVVIPTFTVTFDTDGGSSVDSQTVYYGQTATQPTAPTKTGYTFAGWNNGDVVFDFSTAVTGNVTLKAAWNINTYTVTFDTDGGTAVESQTVVHGKFAAAPNNPTKQGYYVSGWYVGEEQIFFPSYVITEDVTIKAQWSKKCVVTFLNDDGSALTDEAYEPQYIIPNVGPAQKPGTDPTKTGYTFLGWFVDGATTAYDFTTPVNTDITLTAKWSSTPSTAEQLIAAAKAGETEITLTNDIVITTGAAIEIAAGSVTIIDLNGKTLTADSTAGILFNNNGILTIKNGKIITLNPDAEVDGGGSAIYSTGTLVLSNVGIDSEGSYVVYADGANSKLTIDKSTINGRGAIAATAGAKVTIDSGTFTSDIGESTTNHVLQISNSTVTINDGTFNMQVGKTGYAVNIMNNSTVTINGGTFTGKETVSVGSLAVGSSTTGKVTIDGGTFTNIIKVAPTTGGSVEFQAGTFENTVNVNASSTKAYGKVVITGGTYENGIVVKKAVKDSTTIVENLLSSVTYK